MSSADRTTSASGTTSGSETTGESRGLNRPGLRTMRPTNRDRHRLSVQTVPDRRHAQRGTVRCECWLDRQDTSLYSAEADVGPGKLFFRTGVPIMPGEVVRVSLDFADGSRPVIARGVVTEIIEASRGLRNGVDVSLSEIVEGDEEFSSHVHP